MTWRGSNPQEAGIQAAAGSDYPDLVPPEVREDGLTTLPGTFLGGPHSLRGHTARGTDRRRDAHSSLLPRAAGHTDHVTRDRKRRHQPVPNGHRSASSTGYILAVGRPTGRAVGIGTAPPCCFQPNTR